MEYRKILQKNKEETENNDLKLEENNFLKSLITKVK